MPSPTQRQKDQNRMMRAWMITEKMQNCMSQVYYFKYLLVGVQYDFEYNEFNDIFYIL